MSNWQTLSSEEVYKTPWIRVRRDEVLNHNGKPLTYSVVELNSPSVFIVPVNAAGEILIQKTYRYTLNRTLWQLPAGHSDGQAPIEAAKRELLEETGLVSDDWTSLGKLHQAIGIGAIPLEIFLARDVRPTSEERDELEEIVSQEFMSLDKIEALARNGELEDTPMIAALYLAKLHGL